MSHRPALLFVNIRQRRYAPRHPPYFKTFESAGRSRPQSQNRCCADVVAAASQSGRNGECGGRDRQRGRLGGYVNPEARVPQGHPLRQIRPLVNAALMRDWGFSCASD